MNLSPGRVSQMIGEGKLAGCLVGEGREQRIDFDKAIAALKIRRDAGQALGNGAKARLDTAALVEAPRGEADEIDIQLRREKLFAEQARNRRLREEERARAGTYVLAEHVKAETAKLASTMLQTFEQELAAVAGEIAATFKIPERDMRHLLSKRFREVRTKVSARLAADAAGLAPTFEDAEAE